MLYIVSAVTYKTRMKTYKYFVNTNSKSNAKKLVQEKHPDAEWYHCDKFQLQKNKLRKYK